MGNRESKTIPVRPKQVLNDVVPIDITLNKHLLKLQSDGNWKMMSDLGKAQDNYVATLENQIVELKKNHLSGTEGKGKSSSELRREKIEFLREIDELKFKNKVLLAMCTISEGDYLALCKEATKKPKPNKHLKKKNQTFPAKATTRISEKRTHEQFELQIKCRNLVSSTSRSPDPIAKLFERRRDTSDKWTFVGSTEVQKGTADPSFKTLTKIANGEYSISDMEYKVAVFDARGNSSDPINIGNAYVEGTTLETGSEERELELEHQDQTIDQKLQDNGCYVIVQMSKAENGWH